MNPFKTISDQEAETFFRKVDSRCENMLEEKTKLERQLYNWRTHERICKALGKDPEITKDDHTRDLLLMLKITETEYQVREEERKNRQMRHDNLNGK